MYKKIYRSLAGKGLSRWFPNNFFARKATRKMTGDVIAKVQGYEMLVPIEHDYGVVLYLKGIYEAAITKYVKQFLGRGQTFVDVGACLGYYSLLASGIVGPKGRVLAFEPESNSFNRYLSPNIILNNCQNVMIHHAAASDKRGKANLNISSHHIGCHSLLYSEILGHRDNAQIVSTFPIDYYIDRIDMVKIDVEGHEYYVLKGMESFLSLNDKSIIVIQEHIPSLLNGGKVLWDLMDFLECFAHRIHIIDEKRKRLKITTIDDLLKLKERINLLWWS